MKERGLVLLVAAVQFVNILDFMMVLPLGPDFAGALGIPTSHIGIVGGAYTLAAAVSGIVGANLLDRFDRRVALAVAMLGLAAGTALGGVSVGLWSLLGARIVAGAFGGPATSLGLAIVADVVPPAERGKAVGTVMTAFSLASVLGVPAGLGLAQWLGWRTPFFAVALLGLALTAVAFRLMPSLRGHIGAATARGPGGTGRLTLDVLSGATFFNTACVMLGVFTIVPNIATFLQFNIGYPRERLDAIYLVGGLASFFANRGVGMLVDRFGATRLVVAGTAIFVLAVELGFIAPVGPARVIYVFPLLMLSATVRGVPINTLASRVPAAAERARFMSALNAVQHLASAAGAFGASLLLDADASGRLYGMKLVAMLSIAISLVVPFVSWFVERGIAARDTLRERARPSEA